MIDKERVCIFIDGSNFYHGLKNNIGKTNIDFYKLSLLLCGDERKLIRTYYYNAPLKKDEDERKYKSQQRFFTMLKSIPYLEMKLGRLVYRGGIPIEKGVDIYLAIDMLKYAFDDVYDTAILVSGDGDFAKAVSAVRDLGKHVEHAYFNTGQSIHLRDSCDVRVDLDGDFLAKCF